MINRNINSDLQIYAGLIIFMAFSLALNSCCGGAYCEGADNLDKILLFNFPSQDCDSVYVVTYMRGTNYKLVQDSFLVSDIDTSNRYVYYMILSDRKISISSEHKVYFQNANKVYTLSDFKTVREDCNRCLIPFFSDHYDRLSEYKINGNVKQYQRLEIDKDSD